MSVAADLCQLYIITPAEIDDVDAFAQTLDRVLSVGPVACVQLRLKGAADEEILAVGQKLMPICHAHDVAFLVNDRVDLAIEMGADGVHLGQEDGSVADARQRLGDEASIGATCHASRHLGYEAGEQGADYVAFGAFYPSETKETEHRPGLDLLTYWDEVTEIPAVAIGGVTPENCRELADAGAHFVAACGSIWSSDKAPEEVVGTFLKELGLIQ